MKSKNIPSAFILRRIQSLTGLFLILFLFEHFITNSTAALWLDEGNGFVKAVNFFQSIPHLHIIEVVLIGIPILFHMAGGIQNITTAQINSFKSDGTKPSLREFKRNRAYSWQRFTSYIVAVLLIFHVVQMRFIDSPKKVDIAGEKHYLVKITNDKNVDHLIEKMNGQIFYKNQKNIKDANLSTALAKFKLKDKHVVAMTPQSGQAFLLSLRNTLKNPFMVGIYSIFVLATSFHALNGLWTFLISWGLIISNRSQKISLSVCLWLMLVLIGFGLIAVWSSYLY